MRALALDIGEVRIGIAASDANTPASEMIPFACGEYAVAAVAISSISAAVK
jgi:RNase H-fold protein (predicted Holliday junction resolvase)